MPSSSLTLSFLFAGISFVAGLPASNLQAAENTFISEICTSPTENFNALELSLARDFCSIVFDIRTSTSFVTYTQTQVSAAYATVTDTVALSGEYTSIKTTTDYSTVSQTIPPVTDTTTLPAPVITLITTDLETIIQGTTTVTSTQLSVTGGYSNERRQAAGIFASYASSVISTACKCLVTSPVVTKTVDVTDYITTTDVVTKEATVSEFGTTTVVDTAVDLVTATVSGSVVDITLTPSPTTLEETATVLATAEATAVAVVVEDVTNYYVSAYMSNNNSYFGQQCASFLSAVSIPSGDAGTSPFTLAATGAQACAVTEGCLSYAFGLNNAQNQGYVNLYNVLYPANGDCDESAAETDDYYYAYDVLNFNNTGPTPSDD
ncbi:hypothetical protein MMC08_003787 [Hypocenomyce scalaris]|nr:hypothetical protein [Hypocenomyce scalaris]